MNILLIHGRIETGQPLKSNFEAAGHACAWAQHGRHGIEVALHRRFEAIVLNLDLPDMSGLDVIGDLRRHRVRVPVILFSAHGSVEERIAGLKAGADDYLVKPLEFAELMARIEAICRRTSAVPAALELQVGSLRLEIATRRAMRGNLVVELTQTEFKLLEFLMRMPSKVVSRVSLFEHLWELSWNGASNVVDVHVARLRRKLYRGLHCEMIETVRGRGYLLRPDAPPLLETLITTPATATTYR